jgi:hypothetical protein
MLTFSTVQRPVKERIKQLRQEIAELVKEDQALRKRKDFTGVGERLRRVERVEEILAELRSLTDWKKS